MKYETYEKMQEEAERLVTRYVESYRSDWELDKKWFKRLSEEKTDSAVFVVRQCGTLLLPCTAISEKGSCAGQILSYYVDETLDGSPKNRFYLMNFKTCEMKKVKAITVADMICA